MKRIPFSPKEIKSRDRLKKLIAAVVPFGEASLCFALAAAVVVSLGQFLFFGFTNDEPQTKAFLSPGSRFEAEREALPVVTIGLLEFKVYAVEEADGRRRVEFYRTGYLRRPGTTPDMFAYSHWTSPDKSKQGLCGVFITPDLRGQRLLRPLLNTFFSVFPDVRCTHPNMMNPAALALLNKEYGFAPASDIEPNAYVGRVGEKGRLYFTSDEARHIFLSEGGGNLTAEVMYEYEIVERNFEGSSPLYLGQSLIIKNEMEFQVALARFRWLIRPELIRAIRENYLASQTRVALARIRKKLAAPWAPPKTQKEVIIEILRHIQTNEVVIVSGRPRIGKSTQFQRLGRYINLNETQEKDPKKVFRFVVERLAGAGGTPSEQVRNASSTLSGEIVVIDEFFKLGKELPQAVCWMLQFGARVILIGPPAIRDRSRNDVEFFIFPPPSLDEYSIVAADIAKACGVPLSDKSLRRLYEMTGGDYDVTRGWFGYIIAKANAQGIGADECIDSLDLNEDIELYLQGMRQAATEQALGRGEKFDAIGYGLDRSRILPIQGEMDNAMRKRLIFELIDPLPISALSRYSQRELEIFEMLLDYGFLKVSDGSVTLKADLLREYARRYYAPAVQPLSALRENP